MCFLLYPMCKVSYRLDVKHYKLSSVHTFGLSLLLKLPVVIVHKLHHGLHCLIANVVCM